MTKQASLIGTELDCTTRTIELSQVGRLLALFQLPGSDKQHENSSHLSCVPSFWLGNLMSLSRVYKALELNINNVLHSRETIMHYKDLKPGERVLVKTFLKDAYEQQASNNPIGFIILESVGLRNNDLVFYSERVIAVRGGFQRGRSS